MGVDTRKWISKSELYMYLDEKNGGYTYDREIADQIFNKMDKNIDGFVTIDEFVNVFMEAEDVLNDKI